MQESLPCQRATVSTGKHCNLFFSSLIDGHLEQKFATASELLSILLYVSLDLWLQESPSVDMLEEGGWVTGHGNIQDESSSILFFISLCLLNPSQMPGSVLDIDFTLKIMLCARFHCPCFMDQGPTAQRPRATLSRSHSS